MLKDYRDLRIIFMGTPEFAVASLEKLIKERCNIVAVVTAPDKPAGRGMQLQQSAVKKFALLHNLKVLQPEKLKSELFLQELEALRADLQIVVAFRMLPEMVWNMPPLGTINLHGSLLPHYRGAAPINWAVINGESETGVTTFKLKHQIDTGNILLQRKFPISKEDNAGTVHDKMMSIGADLLFETVQGIASEKLVEKPQVADTEIKHAPKIFTETCKIDFSKPVVEVNNLIRGLSPYPTAFTFLGNKKLKIFSATADIKTHNKPIGSFSTDGKFLLEFYCADGSIHVTDLQMEGKKRMKTEDFLRGFRPL